MFNIIWKEPDLSEEHLSEEEGGAQDGECEGVGQEEGEPALLQDRDGQRPQRVEGESEGPAGGERICAARPNLTVQFIQYSTEQYSTVVPY